MHWKELLELAGIQPRNCNSLADFNMALAGGEAYKWRGIGRKKYTLLCKIMDYPEPVFDGTRLIKTPNDLLINR